MLFALACLAFVSLGLPDAALGVAWPDMRAVFALPQSGMGLLLGAAAAGYIASSVAVDWLVSRAGVGLTLALSTAACAVGTVGIALAPGIPALLVGALVIGLGSGAIDAALNAYAARRFSPRGMNWLHAAYGLGAAIGPLIMTATFAAGAGFAVGYASLALILGLLATTFAVTAARWGDSESPSLSRSRGKAFGPRAGAHVFVFFVYTGVEVGAGQWSFAILNEARSLSPTTAGLWTAAYWWSLCIGRAVFGIVADIVGAGRLAALGSLGMLIGALLFGLAPGFLGLIGLVLLGFAAAPIFPMLMTLTARRFDARTTNQMVGLQVGAAMLGAVAVPSLGGALADLAGLEAIPTMLTLLAALLAGAVLLLARFDVRPAAT